MKFNHFTVFGYTLLCLYFLSSCENRKVKNPLSEITEEWKSFSLHWESENVDGIMTSFSEDCINFPPSAIPLEGKQAISDLYNSLFDAHESNTYDHKIVSLDYSDDMAIEHGEFEVHWVRNDSTQWTFSARSLTHWVKDIEGSWKIKRFMFSPKEEENEES